MVGARVIVATSTVMSGWRGSEGGVRRLAKALLQRLSVLTLTLTPATPLVEERVDLFHYFTIVDNYYYILVKVRCARYGCGPLHSLSKHY